MFHVKHLSFDRSNQFGRAVVYLNSVRAKLRASTSCHAAVTAGTMRRMGAAQRDDSNGREAHGTPGGVECSAKVRIKDLALVSAVSALIQGLAAWTTQDVPTSWHLVGDAAGYWDWARSIAAGDWLEHEGFYQAPLYPYLLGLLMALGGASKWLVVAAQVGCSALAAGLLTGATGRMFGRAAGIIAGLMLAAYPPAVFAGITIQKSALDLLLTCALVALLTRRREARAGIAPWAGTLGIVCGLLALTRENALLWVPLCGTYVWWMGCAPNLMARNSDSVSPMGIEPSAAHKGRRYIPWRGVSCFVIGCGLLLGAVAARNAYVSGEWSVTTFQSGPNFYIGNSAQADGRYRPLVRGHETPIFERADAQRLAQEAAGRQLSARAVSRYWWSRACGDIAAAPARWLRVMAYKLLLTVNRYEIADAESLHVYAAYAYPWGILPSVWHFGVLAPLAVIGVLATWSRKREFWIHYLLIASMAASVALFYVLARYRLPVVPLLIPFAAVAVMELARKLRRRSGKGLTKLLAPALVVAVMVNVEVQDEKRLDALAWMNAGVAAAEGGDLASATGCFERAVVDHPESPEVNVDLALALAMQERFAEALTHYETALRSGVDLPGLDYNYAVTLENVGRREDALRHYVRAMERDATDVEALGAVERLNAEP